MPSATEPNVSGKSAPRRRRRGELERWNRKLHYYVGLFTLFFLWLFAFTGLILNHPTWSFAESWTNRKDLNYTRELAAFGPEVKGDVAEAHEIMKQLGIVGEILWTTTRANHDLFDFQVRRPGHFFFLKVDFAQKRVTVRHSEVNLWGVIKVLHTFTGAQINNRPSTRDWTLTAVWVFSMDAFAVCLIYMVLSSLYMWWELPPKRVLGIIVLGLGVLSCGFFCVGLRWLF